MLVTELIRTAFAEAKDNAPRQAATAQALHRGRAIEWVKALARQFQRVYPPGDQFRVFSKYEKSNRSDFGLNELLFDVCVCEVAPTPAAKGTKQLTYIRRGIWQVESEFAKDSRAAVLDFGKLVLGSAPHSLFIGPLLKDAEPYQEALLPVAKCCRGRVFMAMVPHPEDWAADRSPLVRVLDQDGWMACGAEKLEAVG